MNTKGQIAERTDTEESEDLDCEKEGLLDHGNSSIWGGNTSYKVRLSRHKFEWTQAKCAEMQTNEIDFTLYSCSIHTIYE